MKPMLTFLVAALLIAATSPAEADCFAAYKAKQDAPLRLHYGVIKLDIDPCEASAEAEDQISARIGKDGWALLNVVRTMDETDVENERDDAGAYFLRY